MRLAVTLTGWCVAVLIALPGWVYFAGSIMTDGAGLFPCAFLCFAGLLSALVVGCATSSIAKCINPKSKEV